jgi:peptidoglycan hydrolase CwlO-like protein
MTSGRRTAHLRIGIAAVAAAGVCAALVSSSSADPNLGELNSQLSRQQSRQRTLGAGVAKLSASISSLDGQIALVRAREAAVRGELDRDRAELARIRIQLVRERRRVGVLRARLARARMVLARQLVSNYETAKPDLIGVVLEAHGFNDLLERIDFLRLAEGQQQTIIQITRTDKTAADKAERNLTRLERTDVQVTDAAATRVRALAGMNALLATKETALARTRDAQQAALIASRAKGARLRTAIARLRAAQAAAARAAANPPAPARSSTSTPAPSSGAPSAPTSGAPSAPASGAPALGPSGGWAIPYAIVLCESGGQNLPPNGAGASGYYQIVPGTWKGYGGTGPAAYLASKSEQDAVARRIWNGGAGASAWVCAGIVGIT